MSRPLPDIDQMPLPTLSHRVRSLTLDQVDQVIEHEQAHGNRLPVLEVLRARRQDLLDGAEPSRGDPAAESPTPADTPHASPVDPSGAAEPGPPNRHGLRQVTWGG